MNKFQDAFADLKGKVQARYITGLVFQEAVNCLDEQRKINGEFTDRRPNANAEIIDRWQRVQNEPAYPLLKAVGRELIALSLSERLRAVDWIFQNGDRQFQESTWASRGFSIQLASFADTARSVHCIFRWALHPALHIGLTAKLNGRPLQRLKLTVEDHELPEIARLCAAVIDIDIDCQWDDPFRRYQDDEFDYELALPPFGKTYSSHALPKKTLEWLGGGTSGRLSYEAVTIATALAHISETKAIIGVSASTLFRTVGVESVVRDELIASGRLEGVLNVPSGMLYPETGIASSLLGLSTCGSAHPTVRFLDLSDERFATKSSRGRYEIRSDISLRDVLSTPAEETGCGREVPIKEIHENSGILSVERYLNTYTTSKLNEFLERYEVRVLPDVAELIRPTASPKSEDGEFVTLEMSPTDVGEDGLVKAPGKETRVDRGGLRKARNQQLQPGDVVLSVKGTIGKVGVVPEQAPDQTAATFWTAGQSLMILRPRRAIIAPEVLYEYLSNRLVNEYLHTLAGGTVIQSLNMKDLKAFPIPVPNDNQQGQIRHAFQERVAAFGELRKLREQIEATRQMNWPHSQLHLEGEETAIQNASSYGRRDNESN